MYSIHIYSNEKKKQTVALKQGSLFRSLVRVQGTTVQRYHSPKLPTPCLDDPSRISRPFKTNYLTKFRVLSHPSFAACGE